MTEVPPGIVCSLKDYIQSINDPSSLYCLSTGDNVGLAVIGAASLASLIALLHVFKLIGVNIRSHLQTQIFERPLDVLMLSLFITDTLQAIGSVVNFHWISLGKVEVGDFCSAQGIIQNVGETGVALSNIWITSFTLYNVASGHDPSVPATLICIGCSCIFLILIVTLGNTLHAADKSRFIGPTPFWCWISHDYFSWKLFAEYVWLWLGLFWAILIYILLYLFHRGNIVFTGRWFHFRRGGGDHPLSDEASTMLWYPATYLITILPVSIVRWIAFVQERHGTAHTPAAATFACATIFSLGGLFNVILLIITRPEAGLFGRTSPPVTPQMPDISAVWHSANPAVVNADEQREPETQPTQSN